MVLFIGSEDRDSLYRLRIDAGMKSRASLLKGRRILCTLLRHALSLSEVYASGLISFAQAITLFFAAGTENGPAPAMTSATASPGLKREMMR